MVKNKNSKTNKKNKAQKKINKKFRKGLKDGITLGVVLTLLVIILGLLIKSSAYPQESGIEKTNNTWNKPYNEEYAKQMNTWPDCPEKKDRGYLPRQVFCELPDFPDDFERVRNEYKLGRLQLYEIKPDYWKQPEWLPTFMNIMLPLLQNPDFNRFGVTPAPGSSPNEFVREGDFTKESVRFDFLSMSPINTIMYSGVKIVPLWLEEGTMELNKFSDGTNHIEQDPEMINKYFDIEITPDLFLLEPTTPRFLYHWNEKIKVVITAKPNLPKGKYMLAITYTTPEYGLPNYCSKKYLINENGDPKNYSDVPEECYPGLQSIYWHRQYLNLYNSLEYPRLAFVKFFLWQK